MEDHKRKNKKRNQNKRPTNDQLKKIQKNLEQNKKDQSTEVNRTIPDDQTSKYHENDNGIAKVETQSKDIQITDVKDKKGNNRRRNKSRVKENQIVNGHTEQISKSSNEDNACNERLGKENDNLTENKTNVKVELEKQYDQSTEITADKINVSNHLSPIMNQSNRSIQDFFYRGFNGGGQNFEHTKNNLLLSEENEGLFQNDIDEPVSQDTPSFPAHNSNVIEKLSETIENSLKSNVSEILIEETTKNVETNEHDDITESMEESLESNKTHIALEQMAEKIKQSGTNNIFETLKENMKINGPNSMLEQMTKSFEQNFSDNMFEQMKESLKHSASSNIFEQMTKSLETNGPHDMFEQMAKSFKNNKSNNIFQQIRDNSETNEDSDQIGESLKMDTDVFQSMPKIMQSSIENEHNNTLTGNHIEGLVSKTNTNLNNSFQNLPSFVLPSPEKFTSLMKDFDISSSTNGETKINPNAINLEQMIHSVSTLTQHIDPSILSGMNAMVSNLLQDENFQSNVENMMKMQMRNTNENSSQITEIQEAEETETNTECSSEVKHMKEILKNNEQQIEQVTMSEKIETNDHKFLNIKLDEKITRMSNSVETITSLDFSVTGPSQNRDKSEIIEETGQTNLFYGDPKDEDELTLEEALKMEMQSTQTMPKQNIRFHREESIPELIENLIKTGEKKSSEIEKTLKTEDDKGNKIKTIFRKILKKERKSSENNGTQSYEFHEQRIDYDKNNTRIVLHDTIQTGRDIKNMMEVKEPQEINKHTIEESIFLKEKIRNNEKVTKENSGNVVKDGEKNKNGEQAEVNKGFEEKKELGLDDLVEFNPESVNEIFTNLMQGKLNPFLNSQNDRNEDKRESEIDSNDILANKMEAMNNFLVSAKNQLLKNEDVGIIGKSTSNISEMLNQSTKNQENPSTSAEINKKGDFASVMNSILASMTSAQPGTNGDESFSSVFQKNATANIMGQLNDVFSGISQNCETSTNPFENINAIFEQFVGPSKDNASIDTEMFNMINIPGLEKPENIREILQMGETLLGNNLFGFEPNIVARKEEESVTNEQTKEESTDDTITSIEQNDIVKEEKHVSKNVYQEDRPSALLKKLLGDKFWSIKRVRAETEHEIRSVKNETPPPSQSNRKPKSNSITDLESFSSIHADNKFVQKLQKRIQKDTKLQNYLKEKLQKDPKMQKFIQEKLRKDEKLQKFIREKLADNKEMRKNFEEKFEKELGLSGIIPALDDEAGPSSEHANSDISDRENKNNITDSEPAVDPNEVNQIESGNKADGAKKQAQINNKSKNALLLLKRYLEITITMIAIVYVGLICY